MTGTNTGFIAAANGTIKINDTTPNTTSCDGYKIDEATIISSLKINGNATNVIADYISTPATGFVGSELITVSGDNYFSEITLTSGSVTGIKK